MKLAVLERWNAINRKWESRVSWLYLCNEGHVTTGIGNKVSLDECVRLPWVRHNGSLASDDEKRGAWHAVYARQDQKLIGGGKLFWQGLTSLRLPEHAIDQLVLSRVATNEGHFRRRWTDWDTWPADAQFAVMSWSWAVGAMSRYPRMFAALAARDFHAAAQEVFANGANGQPPKPPDTLVERNDANRLALLNAAFVERNGLDADVFHWPRDLEAETPTVVEVPNPPTVPPTDLARVLRLDATRKAVQDGLATRDDEPDDVA